MKKFVCALAILAAAASTAAVAGEIKQDKKATVPTVAATQMTDSEMDKVTAGGQPSFPGYGLCTATSAPGCINFGNSAGGTYALGFALTEGIPKQAPASPLNDSVSIGGGVYTAKVDNPSNNSYRPHGN